MPKLSRQQYAFVREYIASGDEEKAVIDAGYGCRTTKQVRHRAEVLMSNPYIQREIERQRNILDQEPIIKEWYELLHGGDRK